MTVLHDKEILYNEKIQIEPIYKLFWFKEKKVRRAEKNDLYLVLMNKLFRLYFANQKYKNATIECSFSLCQENNQLNKVNYTKALQFQPECAIKYATNIFPNFILKRLLIFISLS